jgi:branched-chain amino acid transport system ATP-binding protein
MTSPETEEAPEGGPLDDILVVEQLSAKYGAATALHGLSFRARAGSILAILGENGAGKTTLLRSLARVHMAVTGKIVFMGRDIISDRAEDAAVLGISLLREGAKVFETLSVSENIALARRLAGLRKRNPSEIDERVARTWDSFPMLGERRNVKAGYLSGGQRQMMALAMALVSEPKMLLLDEPSSGLSESVAEEVYGVIARLSAEGITLVIAEQSDDWIQPLDASKLVLETGQLVATYV